MSAAMLVLYVGYIIYGPLRVEGVLINNLDLQSLNETDLFRHLCQAQLPYSFVKYI